MLHDDGSEGSKVHANCFVACCNFICLGLGNAARFVNRGFVLLLIMVFFERT